VVIAGRIEISLSLAAFDQVEMDAMSMGDADDAATPRLPGLQTFAPQMSGEPSHADHRSSHQAAGDDVRED
jgi:hypothetical protein